ncbi:MAG: hypothetical protein A2Y17_06395 [Clostridiales bacterium GWF2_38_85]|nr:MAG: hypothetical protein A2Y17_06395 [Clostridiales bacterium GWF2_38_85]HBL85523.1 hypothetical protein [Clostridiales bacterium]
MANGIPTQEIGELLDKMAEKLPKMISALMGTLYSAESGKQMGKAVGSFYKELLESGIPQDEAIQMAKDYLLTIKDISKNFSNGN